MYDLHHLDDKDNFFELDTKLFYWDFYLFFSLI